jgi:hypothetical protein
MTSFWKRLKYYLIGFGIGLIFVVIFFQNRGCAWLPGNRVKNSILDKVLVLPEDQVSIMEAKGLNNDEIIQFMNLGKVEFSKSLKDNLVFPKVYVISRTIEDTEHQLQFSLFEDSYISIVRYLEKDQAPERITQPEGMGYFIRVPRDSAMVFIDKSNFVQCKASILASNESKYIGKRLRESGMIDFSKSNLMLPKAEHFITYKETDGRLVQGKTIWFESRITFKDFYWSEPLDCE